jgi:muramoyltetrapeptide carboxypeptidase LdcA involved in peptidoglycan recycling
MTIFPPKIKRDGEIRVIAPSTSLNHPFITPVIPRAEKRLAAENLRITYGRHVKESDEFGSTTVSHRIEDLHSAFLDKNANLILTILGGFNSNQLLKSIDFSLIKSNPKILCGYSDITVLHNAIFAKTGLVAYHGPHMFTVGWEEDNAYTMQYFKNCLFSDKPYHISPSKEVIDHSVEQDKTIKYTNEGHWALQKGNASGVILGGNLCTFNLLQGTDFMPKLDGSILFLEDEESTNPAWFDRELQSVLQQPEADGITGLVIGRFQKESHITRQTLEKIISTKKELNDLPVLANVDFGHTYPMITFPIGGTALLECDKNKSGLQILKH